MAETYQKTRHSNPYRKDETYTEETIVREDDGDLVVSKTQQVVQLIVGFISGLLGIRFLLALFGANPNNGIVDMIYTLSNPLVAPFRNLFASPSVEGASRFEVETLVAIIAYLLLGVLVVRIVELFQRH